MGITRNSKRSYRVCLIIKFTSTRYKYTNVKNLIMDISYLTIIFVAIGTIAGIIISSII